MGAIRGMLRGERGLGQTFWLWWWLPAVIINMAFRLVGFSDPGTTKLWMVILTIGAIIVSFGCGWGVIQSARRSGMTWLGWVASAFVVLSWIGALSAAETTIRALSM